MDFAVLFVFLLAAGAIAIILLYKPELITDYFQAGIKTNRSVPNATAYQPIVTIVPLSKTPTPAALPSLTPASTPASASQCSPAGKCLATKPDYCLNGVIVQNCGQCGCAKGYACKPEGCVPEKFA
ncbi:MAG: hypothetical protein WC792_04960 [Candidatus Micrarchaeia archaeon]